MDALELEYQLSKNRLLAAINQMHVDPVLREYIESRVS